ncbi:MAG: hypothetical protein V4577_04290 [Bacteroidota bacterium]
MSKRSNDENNYPFYWLDELAEVRLNPEKTSPETLKPAELQQIRERLPEEFNRITANLKNQAFSLYCTDHVKVVAGHYDQAIRLLQQQAQINLAQYPASGTLRETGQLLLEGLNELYQSIHQRYNDYLADPPASDPETFILFKVLCRLSVDQIAIILKAADDIKLLVARSFSQVLKTIIPYLSTERFPDFSWKSARSSTYKMEGGDKEIVIQTLELLIRKIKEY